MARKLIRNFSKILALPPDMCAGNLCWCWWGAERGSSVCRPGSKDPHRRHQKLQSMFFNLYGALKLSLYNMTEIIASSFHTSRFLWCGGDDYLLVVVVCFSWGIVKYFDNSILLLDKLEMLLNVLEYHKKAYTLY